MKQIIALLILALTALPLRAEGLSLNLYLGYWPPGAEDPSGMQLMELRNGVLEERAIAPDGKDEGRTGAADPRKIAMMKTAIQAVLDGIAMEDGQEITGESLVIEYSISSTNTFIRGNIVVPFDQQPEAILTLQREVFGATLGPAADEP